MRVLVSGATGLVGSALCRALLGNGYEVRITSRNVDAARRELPPEVEATHPHSANDWTEAARGCDAVINLAGESIAAGRWTGARKKALRRSRLATTASLVDACAALPQPPSVFVSASAVGYYGPCDDEILDESSPAGKDFLAELCVDWEAEAARVQSLGTRLVLARFGVVLAEGGGALERMVAPFRFYAGGPLGSGRQWLSWVHLYDAVGILCEALTNERLEGPVNVVAPDARTMGEVSRALGAALRRPSWIPVPGVALRVALGEMADMLLTGQHVVPAAAERAGYRFRYRSLGDALAELLHR